MTLEVILVLIAAYLMMYLFQTLIADVVMMLAILFKTKKSKKMYFSDKKFLIHLFIFFIFILLLMYLGVFWEKDFSKVWYSFAFVFVLWIFYKIVAKK